LSQPYTQTSLLSLRASLSLLSLRSTISTLSLRGLYLPSPPAAAAAAAAAVPLVTAAVGNAGYISRSTICKPGSNALMPLGITSQRSFSTCRDSSHCRVGLCQNVLNPQIKTYKYVLNKCNRAYYTYKTAHNTYNTAYLFESRYVRRNPIAEYTDCPDQEMEWPLLFTGLIIGTNSYFGVDFAIKKTTGGNPTCRVEKYVSTLKYIRSIYTYYTPYYMYYTLYYTHL
jgi:hypothetical protein